jgi:hypothetical protein
VLQWMVDKKLSRLPVQLPLQRIYV